MARPVEVESRAPVHSSTEPARCPVGFGSATATQASTGAMLLPADQPAVCPFGHGTSARPNSSTTAAKPGGKCPFGYDQPTGKPALTPLHCMLCESLLFDCVAAQPCGHRYCRECISRFRDCPACGQDIDGVTNDSLCQGEVDTFIEAHSQRSADPAPATKSHQADDQGLQVATRDEGANLDGLGAASFFLELGLKSFAGSNYSAALHRLGLCKAHILAAAPCSEAGAKLGAVCGSQGDCCRQMGNMTAATQHYHESITHLRQIHASYDEAHHALSVSLNKLGDLHYLQEDVQAAKGCYSEALEVRRRLMVASKSGANGNSAPAFVARVIDVGVSLGKLMDVDKAIGNEASAKEHRDEAQALVCSIASKLDSCDTITQRKFNALHQLLQQSNDTCL